MAPYSNSDGPSQGGEVFSWVVIAIALASFWPLGLFLLFRKLMSTPSKPAAPRPAIPAPAPAPVAPAAPVAPKSKNALAGTGFIVGGGIMSSVFGYALLINLAEAVATHTLRGAFSGLMALAGLTGAGLVLLYVGLSRRKRARLFRQYQALIGPRGSVSISALAKATGRGYKKVCSELQDMLDFGILPTGYLDLSNGTLVLSSQGIADEVKAPPKPEPEKDEYAILTEIRAVNAAIPDPVMTAKIDRIGQLTGKILDYQRQNPDKDAQLRSFLSYYLPTTLKILRSYAQLDGQGIEGENISAAKARIEGMMDKVVEGFEAQLDRLFRDEALDITSDVAVLEKMLDKDGLGGGSGLPLGGT